MLFRRALIAALVVTASGASADGADGPVLWRGPAPPAAAEARVIRLHGRADGDRFLVSEIHPVPPASAPTRPRPQPLPVAMDLRFHTRAFGGEDRATVAAAGTSLTLRCAPGSAAAGAVLTRPGRRLPLGADLQVEFEGAVEGHFLLAMSDAGRAERENPLLLGPIAALPARLALPARGLKRADWRSFTILCPKGQARFTVDRMRLLPMGGRVAPARATWLWRAEQWRVDDDAVLKRLAGRGIATVFVMVPLTPDHAAVAEPRRLARFIHSAGRHGIAVWAVDGDPRAVLPGERDRWLRRATAFRRYNDRAAPGETLAGLQLDIEPYLPPEYQRDRIAINTRYVGLVADMRAAAAMPLDVVLPFWFDGARARSGPLLDALEVDGITVMDYRTDPALIQQAAEPFLAWGAAQAKPVRIALEYGPLPDQQVMTFERADRGRLWLTPTAAGPQIELLAGAAANPNGPSFRLIAEWAVPAGRVTFHGSPTVLWRRVAELEGGFVAWPSFAGMAIHEPPAPPPNHP